ncbi:hypothetical protein MOBT1_000756 [Malassezia obtusa]|uniref:Dynein heavy chain, cytoplasmic n=1 Tax=Malassezia obtusa TaxID=76774 RepID=A0AAF0DWX5_9BASI|nr:hypothetical protein MOBT1_000756 [Malassezia obtusa]
MGDTALRAYAAALLPTVLGVRATLSNVAADEEWEDVEEAFVSDPSVPVVFLDQHRDDDGAEAFALARRPTYAPPEHVSSVALVKRRAHLDVHAPLAPQLRVVTLLGAPDEAAAGAALLETPYEALETVVHSVMTPWFDAYATHEHTDERRAKDDDIPLVKRKFAELELSLRHLQQSVEIPQVVLAVHPTIRAAVEACEERREPITTAAIEPPGVLHDDQFVNELHAEMNGWVRAVQKITKLDRDAASGTAMQEIHFWNAMEHALEDLEQQLQAPGITLTLEVLTSAKRFHATTSFHTDTGIKDALDKVRSHNVLMRDFPLPELLAATTLPACGDALRAIFGVLTKKLRVSNYPVARALAFVEAIGREANAAVLRVLAERAPMQLAYDACMAVLEETLQVLGEWDEHVKEFVYVARDLTRKRAEKYIPIKVAAAHAPLRARVEYLQRFRAAHQELVDMVDVSRAWSATPTPLLGELRAALETMRDIDPFDVSDKGTELLAHAEAQYNARIAHVEHLLVDKLRTLLDDAQSAREQLRILAQCNRLFVRPKVRAAVQEYQQVLLQSVQSDIDALHAKFRAGFRGSDAHLAAQLRHQPEIVGAIVWANEIERQLHMYLQRVHDVLGAGWEHYADGQRIHAESTTFARKLDTRPLLAAWSQDVARRGTHVTGALLRVVAERATGRLRLVANYDAQAFVFADEAHALTLLGMSIPQALVSAALDARRIYPFALSVVHALRTLDKTHAQLAPALAPLLAHTEQRVRTLLSQAMHARWERFLDSYSSVYASASADALRENAQVSLVAELAAAAVALEEQAQHVARVHAHTEHELEAMASCAYEAAAFCAHLARVQEEVDALSLAAYPNLGAYVAALDARIERVLHTRLAAELRRLHARCAARDERAPVVLGVRVAGGVLALDPPLEHARAHWYGVLRDTLGVVLGLPRVHAARYVLQLGDASAGTYAGVLRALPRDALAAPLARVEARLGDAAAFADAWLALQFLFDVEVEGVAAQLGTDLAAWHTVVQRLRQTRALVEARTTRRTFALVDVDTEPAQARVLPKLDAWEAALLAQYAAVLGAGMRRAALEPLPVVGASTAQIVALLTLVQRLAGDAQRVGATLELYAAGQGALQRQRVRPADWLHAEQVAGEHAALTQLLAAKRAQIDAEHEAIHAQIAAEDRAVAERAAALAEAWADARPVHGAIPVEEAQQTLGTYAARLAEVQRARAQTAAALEAFGLQARADAALDALAEELGELQAVWGALADVWAQLDEVRATPWAAVQPRAVRQRLDGLLRTCRAMPSRVRQYAAYEHVQDTLAFLVQHIPLLQALRADAFRERHWRTLYQRVGRRYRPSAQTLGEVWDVDWRTHLGTLRALVDEAQGEYALDVYLQQVREAWAGYALDLVNYRNECMLVRGLDALFQLANEHATGLRAMSASPHYRVFEEEARRWEERVARVQTTFDLWARVQRQFVYLNGIFAASPEIRHMLPMESGRFHSISTEFLAILRRVQKAPYALEVAQQPGLEAALERLAELLHKIQTALGAYLERERVRFPRFFFVGDEDLLEMLGNSKDVARATPHLSKMFAGIARVDERHGALHAVYTRAGDALALDAPVVLAEHAALHEWLAALEQRVAAALRARLHDALHALERAPDGAAPAHLVPQVAVLAAQVAFTRRVEAALAAHTPLADVARTLEARTAALAEQVAHADAPVRRTAEALLTLLTHEREVVARLDAAGCASAASFAWQYELRHYVVDGGVEVRMANTAFAYGFELLDVGERLVSTPLTTACFTTLTQALHARCGGAPFGPAGTGKTETVKALAHELGRLVFVFNCDSQFDGPAMARILAGLCRVGAWGCFDEFNRLDEHVLSSVSQQIQAIQQGLAAPARTAELNGTPTPVHAHTGIFVTMNPTYAGRSHLPDNLKQLFRSVAMTAPDMRRIVHILLLVHGFQHAAALAHKMVLLFELCAEQLSRGAHYDFGLRALKAAILVQSVQEIVPPKLAADDVALLGALVRDVFPGVTYEPAALGALRAALAEECAAQHLAQGAWADKVVQLYQMQQVAQGLLLVGPAGAGKTRAWRTLLAALARAEGASHAVHVLEPKVWSKEHLFGTLDATTREWTDGLFTRLLRRVRENARRESEQRHWIVFDGDIDPEWVESLNSVLDDNRVLTLPTGERLGVPDHVRLVFEVENVAHATLATITRCGMVAFGAELVPRAARLAHALAELRTAPLGAEDDFASLARAEAASAAVCARAAEALAPHCAPGALVDAAFTAAHAHDAHVMPADDARYIATLFALLRRAARQVLAYNARHADFPLRDAQVATFMERALCVALVWACAGDAPHTVRAALAATVRTHAPHVELPAGELLEHYVEAGPEARWRAWADEVAHVEVETSALASADAVIPTLDTVRQEALLHAILLDHRPVVLCGPPGSGKTMVLHATLRRMADVVLAGLNLSSQTTPGALLTLLEEHCTYEKTPAGATLVPNQLGRWLVVFCDELNLPAPDAYATQPVISFLRELVEQRGFWRGHTWVRLERIQFVGACNPPTDPGRTPLSPRFLRHAPVLLVDYPSRPSLHQIYHTFVRAALRATPHLAGYAEALTRAMVDFFAASQQRFTPEDQAHYVYSPRELTRWVRGLYRVLCHTELATLAELVRVWAYEGLRLFQDRLVDADERAWTDAALDDAARAAFPALDVDQALARPILYSDWLSKEVRSVERAPLRQYAEARLRGYSEEELDTHLVLHDAVLDLALGCDRVLQQPGGHLLLIGVSGSGRTTVAQFCAWLRGLTLYSVPTARAYRDEDFDDDLRRLLRRVGVRGERVCWTMDEAQVAHPARLEKLNTLLANADVPGLFEGEEHTALLSALRDAAHREGLVLAAEDELLAFFRAQILANLHVVLTMNPPHGGVGAKATASPALFNRCTLVYCW